VKPANSLYWLLTTGYFGFGVNYPTYHSSFFGSHGALAEWQNTFFGRRTLLYFKALQLEKCIHLPKQGTRSRELRLLLCLVGSCGQGLGGEVKGAASQF
jgi:hypothetical protein